MYEDLTINVKNTKDELLSFPIDKALILEFSERVEDAYLDAYVYIIQDLDSSKLVHIGDTYNQNVGIVKENFKPVAIGFNIISNNPFTVSVKPLQPLTPGYSYTLLVKEELPNEYLAISKSISYSSSTITLVSAPSTSEDATLTILSDSTFTNGKHLVDISFKNIQKTVDLTYSRKITIDNYVFEFKSDFYIEGEEFTTTVVDQTSKVNTSYTFPFKAASSKNVKALDGNPNTLLTEDLLADYNNSEDPQPVSTTFDINTLTYTIEHTGENSFIVTFNQEVTDLLDLNEVTFTKNEAFRMYTLKQLGLYDPSVQYSIQSIVLDKKSVEFYVYKNTLEATR